MKWTEIELAWLRTNYGEYTFVQLAEQLSGLIGETVTSSMVASKFREMGISSEHDDLVAEIKRDYQEMVEIERKSIVREIREAKKRKAIRRSE